MPSALPLTASASSVFSGHVGKIDLQIQIAVSHSTRRVHNLLLILFRAVQHQNRNDIDYSRDQNPYNTAAAQNQVARKLQ